MDTAGYHYLILKDLVIKLSNAKWELTWPFDYASITT